MDKIVLRSLLKRRELAARYFEGVGHYLAAFIHGIIGWILILVGENCAEIPLE